MRRASGLHTRLASLEELIGGQSQLSVRDPSSLAYRLALRSIEGKRAGLRASLAEALSFREKEVLNLALAGGAFPNHTASFDALAHVLSRAQGLFTSIVQAISVGPTTRGPIPMGIQQLAQLRLAEVHQSSFGMTIELDTAADLLGGSASVTGLDALFALLGTERTTERLLERAAALGPRALSHYRHWLEGLVQTGTSVKLGWVDPFGRDHTWEPGPNVLTETYELLSSIRTESTEAQSARGWLLGASLLRNRFEFVTEEDRTLIAGRIASEAKDSVAQYFGQFCMVDYLVTTTREELAGRRSTSYTLIVARAADVATP